MSDIPKVTHNSSHCCDSIPSLSLLSVSRPKGLAKRPKQRGGKSSSTSKPSSSNLPGYLCFYINGDPGHKRRRSAYTPKRKEQVKQVRKRGACLRCKLMKIACSGEDPCKPCLAMLHSDMGSRALMWMECIRPSLQTLDIFEKESFIQSQAQIRMVLQELVMEDVYLDFIIPFEMRVDAACKHFSHWLTNSSGRSDFSVVGLFSSVEFTEMLQQTLGVELGSYLRLLVYLTTFLYTAEDRSLFCATKKTEASKIRDYVGNTVLERMDSMLKPASIESSHQKHETLQALFLSVLGTLIAVRYTILTPKSRELLRLLSHYLAFIGKSLGLFEDSCAEFLVNKCETQWDKAACYTWHNPKRFMWDDDTHCHEAVGLLSTAGEDICDFIADSDLVKCILCGIFWSELDVFGHCPGCQLALNPCRQHTECSVSNDLGAERVSDISFFNEFDFSQPSDPLSFGPPSVENLSIMHDWSDWPHGFCLSCDRQISVGEYCSQACRIGDVTKMDKNGQIGPADPASSDSSSSSFYLPLNFQLQETDTHAPHLCQEENTGRDMSKAAYSGLTTLTSTRSNTQNRHQRHCPPRMDSGKREEDFPTCVRHCSECGDVFVASPTDETCSNCEGVGVEGFEGVSQRLLI